MLLPDQDERGRAKEDRGDARNHLALVLTPARFGKALVDLNVAQFKFAISGQAAPGRHLLSSWPAEVLALGRSEPWRVMPAGRTQESRAFALQDTSVGSCDCRVGGCLAMVLPAGLATFSPLQPAAAARTSEGKYSENQTPVCRHSAVLSTLIAVCNSHCKLAMSAPDYTFCR